MPANGVEQSEHFAGRYQPDQTASCVLASFALACATPFAAFAVFAIATKIAISTRSAPRIWLRVF
jgi:hypothetical protein